MRLGSEAPLAKINSFFEDAFNSSCEGIMVKSLDVDADYVASKRTDTWLKVYKFDTELDTCNYVIVLFMMRIS